MSSPMIIKTQYPLSNGSIDTRRFQLNTQDTIITPYTQIINLLKQTYGQQQVYALKYQDDDGDSCSIGSDLELNEAFRVYTGKVLKLEVAVVASTIAATTTTTTTTTPAAAAATTPVPASATVTNPIADDIQQQIADVESDDDIISLDGSFHSDFTDPDEDDESRASSPVPSERFDPTIQSQVHSEPHSQQEQKHMDDSVIQHIDDDQQSSVSTHQQQSTIVPIDALDMLNTVQDEIVAIPSTSSPVAVDVPAAVDAVVDVPAVDAVSAPAVIVPEVALPSVVVDIIADMVAAVEISPAVSPAVAVSPASSVSVPSPSASASPSPVDVLSGIDPLSQSVTEAKYDAPVEEDEKHGTGWACQVCTFYNTPSDSSCSMCLSNRVPVTAPAVSVSPLAAVAAFAQNAAKDASNAIKDVINAITPSERAAPAAVVIPVAEPVATPTATATATSAPAPTPVVPTSTVAAAIVPTPSVELAPAVATTTPTVIPVAEIAPAATSTATATATVTVLDEKVAPAPEVPAVGMGMSINVKTPDGKTISVQVDANDSIEKVKQKIAAAEGLSGYDCLLYTAPTVATSTVVPPSTEFIHQNITCDGCGMHPLIGARFHCTVCSDYDLCQTCEAANVHDPTHTMIKMRAPAATRPVPTPHPMPMRPPPPFYHHVPPHAGLPAGFGGGQDLGSHGYGYPHPYHPYPHMMSPPPMPMPHIRSHSRSHSHSRSRSSERPRAEFIPTQTSNGFVVELNSTPTVHKRWSLRNSGITAWPAGSAFVHISGKLVSHQDGTESIVTILPECQPGQTVHVACDIAVPNKVGRYRGHYRLMTAERERFGPKIWACIEVVPNKTAEVEEKEKPLAVVEQKEAVEVTPAPAAATATATPVPVVATTVTPSIAVPVAGDSDLSFVTTSAPPALEQKEEEPAFEYANELSQLSEMGFTDIQVCKYLLLSNKGDFAKVCEWLLQEAK